jgi:hypothetical protein
VSPAHRPPGRESGRCGLPGSSQSVRGSPLSRRRLAVASIEPLRARSAAAILARRFPDLLLRYLYVALTPVRSAAAADAFYEPADALHIDPHGDPSRVRWFEVGQRPGQDRSYGRWGVDDLHVNLGLSRHVAGWRYAERGISLVAAPAVAGMKTSSVTTVSGARGRSARARHTGLGFAGC